jgi:hypothetical protein
MRTTLTQHRFILTFKCRKRFRIKYRFPVVFIQFSNFHHCVDDLLLHFVLTVSSCKMPVVADGSDSPVHYSGQLFANNVCDIPCPSVDGFIMSPLYGLLWLSWHLLTLNKYGVHFWGGSIQGCVRCIYIYIFFLAFGSRDKPDTLMCGHSISIRWYWCVTSIVCYFLCW